MSGPRDIESAIGWLRAQAADLQFGRVGIELVLSDGRLTRIITTTEVSNASVPTGHRGQSDGRPR